MSSTSTERSAFARSLLTFTSVLPAALAVLAALYFGATVLGQDVSREMFGAPPLPADRADAHDAAEGSPREMVERHGCWTGEPPADMVGVMPGHVVVTVDGDLRYGADRLVGLALEQIFEDVDHGLVVHAFCR